MHDFTPHWPKLAWKQPYTNWPQPVSRPVDAEESAITDLTQARELLARIMQKRI